MILTGKKIFSAVRHLRVLAILLILATIGATLHRYFLGEDHIKNFFIFKNAFQNLISSADLYSPQEWKGMAIDYFKYSPTFALLFAPFAIFPDAMGVVLWNLLNSLILFFALAFLPMEKKKQWLIIILVFLELLTSIQNCQSNGLMAGLMIMAFAAMENNRVAAAGILITISIFIKLFSVVLLLLIVLYPRPRIFFSSIIIASVVMLFLPLLAVSYDQLIFLYDSWFELLAWDKKESLGISLFGILQSWFGIIAPKTILQFTSLLLCTAPLLNFRSYSSPVFRQHYFSMLLVWMIVFNHKAESPLYVIAMAGIAIWYVSLGKTKFMNHVLFGFAFLLISLSPTDMFPAFIRNEYIKPYNLKALPAVIMWIVMMYSMITTDYSEKELSPTR